MLTKVLFFILVLVFFTSCRATGETVVNGQTGVETNIRIPQPEVNNSRSETISKTFAKTSVVNEALGANSREIIYTEHSVEFKDDDSGGISVYVDGKKKAFLKIETNRPKIRADFLESSGERFFVLIVGSAGFGSCGDSIFAVVKINEKLDVNMSKTNGSDCQGEYYDVKIESVNNKGNFYRQITIGTVNFNLKSFDWQEKSK